MASTHIGIDTDANINTGFCELLMGAYAGLMPGLRMFLWSFQKIHTRFGDGAYLIFRGYM